MRIVSTTRILNEADIVEAFVRHNACHVDHFIFNDNGSTDGTLDILEKLQREGFSMTILQNDAPSFSEVYFNTSMYNLACQDGAADWVMPLDADEFIDDRKLPQGLASFLSDIAAETLCIRISLRNYYPTEHDDASNLIIPYQITHTIGEGDGSCSKIMGRGNIARHHVVMEAGGHDMLLDGDVCPSLRQSSITYAHYPERSFYHLLSKSVIGWACVLAAGEEEIQKGRSIHYKGAFDWVRNCSDEEVKQACGTWARQQDRILVKDQINYRGGDLLYTKPVDWTTRSMRLVVEYLHRLARKHGEMIDLCKEIKKLA